MSEHFSDARYHLGQAARHAKSGVKRGVESVGMRVRTLVGKERPEPSRRDKLRNLGRNVGARIREAAVSARGRIAALGRRTGNGA